MTTAAASRLIQLEAGCARAKVYPEQGFQLHQWKAPLGADVVDVIFGPDVDGPEGGREPRDRRYGNPVLFPSVGVTTGIAPGGEPDGWSHGGRWLTMQQHGWARDAYWHVVDVDQRSVTGLLVPSTGFRASFPFDFELRLRYTLAQSSLALDAEIVNQGPDAFPYALGFHPYLRAPLAGGERNSCRVHLPAGTRLRSSDGWRSIERIASDPRTISAADPELPGSIVLADTNATALVLEDATTGATVRVSAGGPAETFPVWVIWSAAPDAPYICLEPWTDAPNALNRPGTRTLRPGETHRYNMTMAVEAARAP